MKLTVCPALGLLFLIAAAGPQSAEAAENNVPLRLVATTPMPGFAGDFDHFGVDLKGGRIFLAAEEAQTVEVFDLKSGKRLHRIPGIGHPLTMQYLDDSDRLLVTDGGYPEGSAGAVRVVDTSNYRIAASVALPPGVDHSAYNPKDHCFYVESSTPGGDKNSHQINVIDLGTLSVVGTVPVPGADNEGMVIDRAGEKLYVNLTGVNTVGVIDLATRRLIAQWPLPKGGTVAHGICLDEQAHRLFTVTRKAPRFVVMDLESGAVVADNPCVGMNSDITWDAPRRRVYITGSDFISVFTQTAPDQYEHLAEVPSAYRAKSSIFVPELDRLYVAASGKGKPGTLLKLMIFAAQ